MYTIIYGTCRVPDDRVAVGNFFQDAGIVFGFIGFSSNYIVCTPCGVDVMRFVIECGTHVSFRKILTPEQYDTLVFDNPELGRYLQAKPNLSSESSYSSVLLNRLIDNLFRYAEEVLVKLPNPVDTELEV